MTYLNIETYKKGLQRGSCLYVNDDKFQFEKCRDLIKLISNIVFDDFERTSRFFHYVSVDLHNFRSFHVQTLLVRNEFNSRNLKLPKLFFRTKYNENHFNELHALSLDALKASSSFYTSNYSDQNIFLSNISKEISTKNSFEMKYDFIQKLLK